MNNSNIVNIVNFIRAVEPRCEVDLFEPIREQMAMAKQYDLPTTWLLQYDALTQGPYVEYLKREMPSSHEVGIWFETVQPNVESAGIKWRGRWAWDWHTDVGFSVGYSPEERERIADKFIARFIEVFGHPPASMGSWLFDAHLLDYVYRKWGIVAACNCKDQYGTDGYTLWGGYWANGYYPSRKNSYMPAQTAAEQIDVPVFRMLGSDPLYQYGCGIEENGQRVITLEPVYKDLGGGSHDWIDWFMEENFSHPHGAMAYAQAGQENPFGWPLMKHGLTYQYQRIAQLRDIGKIRVETLENTGRWFKKNFAATPVSTVVTRSDWKNENHAGIWYLSKHGRLNLFQTAERQLVIRDWQIFNENYPEPFLNSVCTSSQCTYDALPVIDGMLWHPAAMSFPGGAGHIETVSEVEDDIMEAVWKSDDGRRTVISLAPKTVTIDFAVPDQSLIFGFNATAAAKYHTEIRLHNGCLIYTHNNMSYRLSTAIGKIEPDDQGFRLHAEGNRLQLKSELV